MGHDWGHLISKQGTKDNHLSYYLIFFTSFLTGQLCMFPLFLQYVITMDI